MGSDAKSLYLGLMKQSLTCSIYPEMDGRLWPARFILRKLIRVFLPQSVRMFQVVSPKDRSEGRYWPAVACTMLGTKRLDNLQFCIEDVLAKNVSGDIVETGVWRGGASILARAVLKAYGVTNRKVWAADSFEGLPRPDKEKYPADAGDPHHFIPELAVSLEQVKANFQRFGLLDDQVHFLKGWFRDTLPAAPIERLAVMRLDGDMYESTMDALVNLYSKLSAGGYVIVDDYGDVPGCRQAVHDFRAGQNIVDEIRPIDGHGIFWQRSGSS